MFLHPGSSYILPMLNTKIHRAFAYGSGPGVCQYVRIFVESMSTHYRIHRWVWWLTPVMPVLRSLRWENCNEFDISIDLTVGPYVRKPKQLERGYHLSAVLFYVLLGMYRTLVI